MDLVKKLMDIENYFKNVTDEELEAALIKAGFEEENQLEDEFKLSTQERVKNIKELLEVLQPYLINMKNDKNSIDEINIKYDKESKEFIIRVDNMKNTKVISGFPGVGKSVLTKQSNLIVLDSDSSLFSWISEGVRNPDFPNNYIQHIQNNIGKVDYIFVSSHDIVRGALKKNNIDYTLVYPAIELKEEYLGRYKNRGNNEGFIKFIGSNWDQFIQDIEAETFPKLIKLCKGQFLSDALEIIGR